MTVKSSKNFAIHKSSTADKYSYLNKHNAYALGGYTIRWKSKTIQVSGAKGAWKNAVKRWPTVRFRFVGSPPSRGKGIEILGYVNSGWTGNTCGYASWSFWGDGRLATCKIKMNPSASCKSRPLEQNIMTHEIGHCIGIFKHTTDHGVMDAIVGNSTFTSPVRRMITLLYSLPPGTNINSKLSRSAATKQRSNSDKYDPTGVKLYSGSSYFMKNGEVKIVPNW